MKGFAIAAIASSVGSTLVFLMFRMLFSRRLHRWSAANEKWQALESVVVRILYCLFHTPIDGHIPAIQRPAFDHSYPDVTTSTLDME
jgi:hypothetical protein